MKLFWKYLPNIGALLALGLIAAAVWYAPAKAADLNAASSMSEAVPVAKSPWSGPYVGVTAAVASTAYEAGLAGEIAANGVIVGGLAGWNFDVGGAVLGVEADVSVSGVTGSSAPAGIVIKTAGRWQASLRARAGLPVGPALVFATLGYAWSDDEIKVPLVGSDSATREGIVYGGGLEVPVGNFGVRMEVLRTDWRSESVTLGGVNLGKIDATDTVGRAVLLFRF